MTEGKSAKSIRELIEKIESLTRPGAEVQAVFSLEILILSEGYVLKYQKGRSVYDFHFEPEFEAIERESRLMDRIGEIISEKRGTDKVKVRS